ncbi:MAG: hypothetical protein K8H88_07780 [Sandaracinaceae bacterium]|nr:hypothetical protein [Sandaracinaceae bacterium]
MDVRIDNLEEMARLDVPATVRAHLADQAYPRLYRLAWTAYLVVALTLILAPMLTVVALMLVLVRVEPAAGQYFVVFDGMIWLIVAEVVSTGAGMLPLGYLERRLPPRLREYMVASSWVQSARVADPLTAWLCRRAARRQAHAEPRSFIHRLSDDATRGYMRFGAAATVIAIACCALAFGHSVVGDARGVHLHSPWREQTLAWSSLERVEVGCARTSRGHPEGIYELHFAGGASVDAFPHQCRADLEGLARLDTRLRSEGATFVHAPQAVSSVECARELAERRHDARIVRMLDVVAEPPVR